jgi:hypothetical protein
MKRDPHIFLFTVLIWLTLNSCHSGATNNSRNSDTAVKTSTDTSIIPGSPGPSGTQPGPGDTTQAHRDSLKNAVHISDSSAKVPQ